VGAGAGNSTENGPGKRWESAAFGMSRDSAVILLSVAEKLRVRGVK